MINIKCKYQIDFKQYTEGAVLYNGKKSIYFVCMEALNEILSDNADKEVVVGTYGTALSTILNFHDNSFGCEDFLRIIDWMPYIIELDFEGDKLVGKHEHCYVEKEFKGKSNGIQRLC